MKAEAPLREWFVKTERADWNQFTDVRATLSPADLVEDEVIFNIGGNGHRLIAVVNYVFAGVPVKWIGTHAEYDLLTKEDIRKL